MKEFEELKAYRLAGDFTTEVMEKVELAQRLKGLYAISRMGRTLTFYSFGRSARRKVVRRKILISRRERC